MMADLVHTGRRSACKWRVQKMEPVVANWIFHTARKQDQRLLKAKLYSNLLLRLV